MWKLLGNFIGPHFGKIVLKIIAFRCSYFAEINGKFPEDQCEFRKKRLNLYILNVIKVLQEIKRKKDVFL